MAAPAFAQSTSLNEEIKLPAEAREGRLKNGLRYLILPNDIPAGRVEFRLVWRVGALQQEEDQGGAAHFLEHLAFGGSTHFPGRSAVAYLESMGMKYGVDINAFTGHDRTIYMFAAPADSLRNNGFAKPLGIIRDWIDQLTINPARVETEKGIILEELRSFYQEDPFYDLKIGQNRYSQRMPLGTPEEIRRMTADRLRSYYDTWYAPRFASVVIVGDLDPDSLERELTDMLAPIPARPDPGFRSYPLEYSPSRNIMLDIDSLASRDEVEFIVPHPGIVTHTLADARRRELNAVVTAALAKRLADRGIKTDVSDAWYLGDTNHLVLTARSSAGLPIDSCIALTAREVKGALRFGFLPEEIEYHAGRAAGRLDNSAHSDYSSAAWCEELADRYLSGDSYVTDSDQLTRLREAVAGISAAEADSLLLVWMDCMDKSLLLAVRTSPDRASRLSLDHLTRAWADGFNSEPLPYAFAAPEATPRREIAAPPILTTPRQPRPEAIINREVLSPLELHTYTLTNGMQLAVRRTTDDGPAMFAMVAPGGFSSIPADRLPLLGDAASYIDLGGIAAMPYEELSDYMYESGLTLSTAIEKDWHGFLGAFEPARHTEFFNLLHEKILHPELRYEDFEEIRLSMLEDAGKESMLEKMLNRAPDRRLRARLDELMGNSLPSSAPTDTAALKRNIRNMSLDSIAAFYQKLYLNPERCTFIVAGNCNPDSIAADFAALFSDLPAASQTLTRFSPLSLPQKTLVEQFPNENPSQTEFDYIFFSSYSPGLRNSLILKIMNALLGNRVISELRESRSLVYSPYVGLTYEGLPRGYCYFDINSSADNANMEAVEAALRDVIHSLRSTPPTASELEAIKLSCKIAKRETLTPYSPSAWRTTLISLLKNGESFSDFNNYDSIIDSITPEEIQQAFDSMITPDLYLLLYMSRQTIPHHD